MCSRWRDASSCVSGRTQLKKRKRPYACCKTHTREQINRRYAGMKEYRATKLIGILGVTGGLAILLGFSAERSHSTRPVQVPVPPPVSDSSPLPSPAAFPNSESSPLPSAAQDRDSRIANARRPLTAKAVRQAAFKYNGVANFCGFLAALPANVSVFDPKLGTTRVLELRTSHPFLNSSSHSIPSIITFAGRPKSIRHAISSAPARAQASTIFAVDSRAPISAVLW